MPRKLPYISLCIKVKNLWIYFFQQLIFSSIYFLINSSTIYGHSIFYFQYKNGYLFDGEKSTYFHCNKYCSICGKIGDSLPKWGDSQYWDWYNSHTLADWVERYPTAEVINLGEIYSFYDIKNINEVRE